MERRAATEAEEEEDENVHGKEEKGKGKKMTSLIIPKIHTARCTHQDLVLNPFERQNTADRHDRDVNTQQHLLHDRGTYRKLAHETCIEAQDP